MKSLSGKEVIINNDIKPYFWHKNYENLQKKFFPEPVEFDRKRSIEDFLHLNTSGKKFIIQDNKVMRDVKDQTSDYNEADTVVITDQKFSRLPCPEIIRRLNKYLHDKKQVLVCLNRTYINIDNSYHDTELAEDYQVAIHQWICKNVNGAVTNLSKYYFENGTYFTWVIPDQIFFIKP